MSISSETDTRARLAHLQCVKEVDLRQFFSRIRFDSVRGPAKTGGERPNLTGNFGRNAKNLRQFESVLAVESSADRGTVCRAIELNVGARRDWGPGSLKDQLPAPPLAPPAGRAQLTGHALRADGSAQVRRPVRRGAPTPCGPTPNRATP